MMENWKQEPRLTGNRLILTDEQKLEMLERLRKLFTPPGTWMKGQSAGDVDGREVEPWARSAVKFCLVGGIRRSLYDMGILASKIDSVSYSSIEECIVPDGNIIGWNDREGRSKRHVTNRIDKGIARLRAQISAQEGRNGIDD